MTFEMDFMLSAIRKLDNKTLLKLHNAYCLADDDLGSIIYTMDELPEVVDDIPTIDLIKMVTFGNFKINRAYFHFDGYGNLTSADSFKAWVHDFDIANYILKSNDDLEFDEIREALDKLHSSKC